ncbi:type II toxin-antitoxin system RelE family toxin [Micromonospora sp. WMMD730]|uniref:type II toxin-antitoxin system RelE family toxin n=1 Tax=Micromonospora sp. WMMD730 TaxID=3404128 RepID=UPI003B936FDA
MERAAAKLLRKLDRPVQARLVAAIAALATEPRPAEVKALTGYPGLLRILGNHRIVYTVRDQELIVLVVHLGHRSDVYDTL